MNSETALEELAEKGKMLTTMMLMMMMTIKMKNRRNRSAQPFYYIRARESLRSGLASIKKHKSTSKMRLIGSLLFGRRFALEIEMIMMTLKILMVFHITHLQYKIFMC